MRQTPGSAARRSAATAVVVGVLFLAAACGPPTEPVDHTGRAAPSSTAPPTRQAAAGWSALPASPLSPRHGATGAWVDGAFLVVGGRTTDPCPPGADCATPKEPALSDGARFDPKQQVWTTIAPAPIPLDHASTAVVGSTLYLWLPDYGRGGRPRADFLAYDAAGDDWSQLPLPATVPAGLVLAAAGDGVLGVMGSHERGWEPDLAYDAVTETWRELPRDPLAPSFDRQVVAVGDDVVLLAQDLVDSPGSTEPSLVRAGIRNVGTRDWRVLPDSEVAGGWGPWFAAGDQVVNPVPGGVDGGEVNGYGRTYPVGGILDVEQGSWLPLPREPETQGESRVPPAGDAALVVGVTGYALVPGAETLTLLNLPPGGGEEAQAGAVGQGRYYLWGGVRWSADGELSNQGWVWTPPAP